MPFFDYIRRPFNPNQWRVAGPVDGQVAIPFTNVDGLLRRPLITSVTHPFTATGEINFLVIGSHERWHLKGLHAVRLTGDQTFDAFFVNNGITQFCIYGPAAATRILYMLPQKIILEPGWSIYVGVPAGTNGNARFDALYEMEPLNILGRNTT